MILTHGNVLVLLMTFDIKKFQTLMDVYSSLFAPAALIKQEIEDSGAITEYPEEVIGIDSPIAKTDFPFQSRQVNLLSHVNVITDFQNFIMQKTHRMMKDFGSTDTILDNYDTEEGHWFKLAFDKPRTSTRADFDDPTVSTEEIHKAMIDSEYTEYATRQQAMERNTRKIVNKLGLDKPVQKVEKIDALKSMMQGSTSIGPNPKVDVVDRPERKTTWDTKLTEAQSERSKISPPIDPYTNKPRKKAE